MSEHAMGRRQALRGAGITAGGVAIAGFGAAPAMADGNSGLLGSWMVVKQDDGFPDKTRAVHSYADGGVFQYHAISPAGPPATGTWLRHGKSFRSTFWSGFAGDEGPGSVGPTVRVRLVGMLQHGKISGTYRFTVFAPGSETEVVQSGTGKFNGRRINA